jgi:hypothetical protein
LFIVRVRLQRTKLFVSFCAMGTTDDIPERPSREERITFKATMSEKRSYARVATILDAPTSDWIRKTLNAAVAAFDAQESQGKQP